MGHLDEVLQAEVIKALQAAQFNHCCKSQASQPKLFKYQFPDSKIADQYQPSSTKTSYLIKYGIAEDVLSELKNYLKDKPFTFEFDETTTKQVKNNMMPTSHTIGTLPSGHPYPWNSNPDMH